VKVKTLTDLVMGTTPTDQVMGIIHTDLVMGTRLRKKVFLRNSQL
jgi:hypothetical protein